MCPKEARLFYGCEKKQNICVSICTFVIPVKLEQTWAADGLMLKMCFLNYLCHYLNLLHKFMKVKKISRQSLFLNYLNRRAESLDWENNQ